MRNPSDQASPQSPSIPGVIAPPPVLYLGCLIPALAVSSVFPFPLPFPSWSGVLLGTLFLLAGGLLARWSFVVMKRAGTSASPRQTSAALVTAGPFSHSRNPIYVAMTLLYAGISLAANSAWPLLMMPGLLGVMHRGVILREERYLHHQFGESYAAYCARVRRWL